MEYAIIVAGGKGSRMNSVLPKQFIELNGLPILMHTLNAFYQYSENISVILVLPANDFETWTTLCKNHDFTRPYILQAGGVTRFQSVRNGLSNIKGEGIVAVHDGVRPLVTPSIIARSFELARQHKSAVAAVPLKESIRMVAGDSSTALNRSAYRLIQTPQTFDVTLLQNAYTITEDDSLTDDASVVERAGHAVTLFDGSYANIKVTTPEDLVVAQALIASGQG